MNYFKGNRLLYWIIAILVVLNISTLAILWMQNNHNSSGENHMERRAEKESGIASALNLSDVQLQQFKKLKEEQQNRVEKIRKEIKDAKKRKLEILTTSPIDTSLINQRDQDIGAFYIEMEKSLCQHYYSLQSVCNDEQKELLKKRFRKIFDRSPPSSGKGRRGKH